MRRIAASGGLATDPSAIVDPMALRQADNVMLHRDGIITPRPGFGDLTGIASRSTTRRPVAIVPYGGDLVIQTYTSSDELYRLERGSTTTVYSNSSTPPELAVRGVSSFAQARGSLYMTTDDGVEKIDAITATGTTLAGVRNDYTTPWINTTTVLADISRHAQPADSAVAYRYCWVSEDANGYIRRSAPSARWVEQRTAIGTYYINTLDQLYLAPGTQEGDRLELYRTEGVTPYTSTPGTEYFLVLTYEVTSGDVSLGYIATGTIVDDIPDARLGATLYTSPSQGGIQQSNEPPPLANLIAPWGGVMWYGNIQQRHVLEIELVNVHDDDDADGSADRIGWCCRLQECDTTNGNPTITGIPDVRGLKVGQYVANGSGADGPVDAGTQIPALTQLSAVLTGVTVDNASLTAGDTIKIWGETFTWHGSSGTGNQIVIGATSTLSAANLAAEIHGRAFAEDVTISAIASGPNVTITETSAGHGVQLTVTESIPGGVSVAYAATMDANATANGSNIPLTFHDWITINGVDFYADLIGGGISQNAGFNDSSKRLAGGDFAIDSETTAAQLAQCATGLERAVNGYAIETNTSFGIRVYRDIDARLGGASNGPGALVFLRSAPDEAAFTVSCTVRPEAWRPNLATAITSPTTRARGRIYWSKPQEPEAVPFLNFTDVGNRDADILALVPLGGDALLVFKEDGIFSITGSAPSSWVINEIDLSTRLLHSQCTAVLGGVCFAWTNHGVVAVTSTAMQRVSRPIDDQLRELARQLPLDATGSKTGTSMVAHDRYGLVILSTSATPTNATATTQYVLHAASGRWSTWSCAARCWAYDPAEDRLVMSPDLSAWVLHYERSDEDAAASYRDAALTSVAASASSTTVTIATAAFGDYTPAIGDVLVKSGTATARRITTTPTSGGGNYTITIDSAFGSSITAVDWHQGYQVSLMWQGQQLPSAGVRWGEHHYHFGAQESAYVTAHPLTMGGQTERDSTSSTQAHTLTALTSPRAGVVRIGPPRDIVRAARLYPYLSTKTAGVRWTLEAVDLHQTGTGMRVAR